MNLFALYTNLLFLLFKPTKALWRSAIDLGWRFVTVCHLQLKKRYHLPRLSGNPPFFLSCWQSLCLCVQAKSVINTTVQEVDRALKLLHSQVDYMTMYMYIKDFTIMHCNDYDNMNNANNYYGYDDNCIMTK